MGELLRIPVLDHGYVSLVEPWGSDERIIEAARMSTQKGFEGWGTKDLICTQSGCARIQSLGTPGSGGCLSCGSGLKVNEGDEKLLTYLWKNNHATPFEMAGLIVEVQAPIFVFREWHRHRTQSYNEMSARYAPLPDLNYVPTIERLLLGGGHLTKQAAGTGAILDVEMANAFLTELRLHYDEAEHVYQSSLKGGVPKELARLVLPVGRYSRMRASANLRNWLAFLTLRADSKAQWEIRQYAFAVAKFIEQQFPRTYALYAEGRK
jgi:thymidylate synthase (FAD)